MIFSMFNIQRTTLYWNTAFMQAIMGTFFSTVYIILHVIIIWPCVNRVCLSLGRPSFQRRIRREEKVAHGDSVYIGAILPLEVGEKTKPTYNNEASTFLSSIFPKSILPLRSMKYLPLAKLATNQLHQTNNFTETVYAKEQMKKKRDTDEQRYVKLFPPETGRQKPMIPSWATLQYNKRPMINTPWMKDTQGVAMNTMNTINGALLEMSDIDIQKETARANLLLVQKMSDLVAAEKEKVRAEISKMEAEVERLEADRDRAIMDTHKLEMEKELLEARIMSGGARSATHKQP